jgi:hypothetical protein
MMKGNPNCDSGLMDLNSPDYDFAREWRVLGLNVLALVFAGFGFVGFQG